MARDLPSSIEVVLEVVAILDELQVRYHLGGSFAAAIHGVPRQTRDADVVVDLDAGTAAQLVERLKAECYVDGEAAAAAVSRQGSFNAIHLATGFKVDFFVAGSGDFDAEELDRASSAHCRRSTPLGVGEIRRGHGSPQAAVVPRRW
jgi:hypothetical protein